MSQRVPRSERAGQLLDVALELMVERGYGGVTMSAVAEAAGVSKPIVYRSYPNRAALLVALLRREQKRAERKLDEAIPSDPGDRHPRELLITAVSGILDAVEESPLTWRLVLLPQEGTPKVVRELIGRRRDQFLRRARRLVRWGVPYLESDEDLDLDILARFLLAIVEEQARMMLADPPRDRAELIASTEAVIDGVAWRERPGARAG
jgi:AcrR family transcriptional regulator